MSKRILAALALTATLALAPSAQAHRTWLLPSTTVLSGEEAWVTVDAAVSNELFIFEYVPLRIDGLSITGPDGAAVAAENSSTGKFRTSFDVRLTQPGTYKLALASTMLGGTYELKGERKRWRGTAETLAKDIPAEATDVVITEGQRRLETFITSGKPTGRALLPTGKGLELEPITHPNDLFAGEEARFRLLLDGKPAAGVKVTLVPGGTRYRTRTQEMTLTADADGIIAVTWPAPGMYWMGAEHEDTSTTVKGASRRMASYTATLEVLPQ